MNPLPAPKSHGAKTPGEVMPSLPTVLSPEPGRFSKANRRANGNPVHRVYPWLLSLSTGAAAVFCLLYITKPVIVPASIANPGISLSTTPPPPLAKTPESKASLLPNGNSLPGEHGSASPNKPTPADPRRILPTSPSPSAFEETNLRIQHVLTAEAPGGHLDRIDLDVPVLYQSRNLRWTAPEVDKARELLLRLMDHQEKMRKLRAEGVELLDSWNSLVGASIPASELRADSPTLPDNQSDAADLPRPAGLTTTDSIEIQSSGK